MARTSMGHARSRTVILMPLAAILLVAVAVLVGRPTALPPAVSEPTAERIATDLVTQWEASDSDAQIVDVVVERYEDHDTFWRVTLHADLLVGRDKTAITYHYQIDVDKETATPSLYNQG